MQTSAQGIAALEHEEGVVLKAYRDVVGFWTIGPGLTAASGVIRPKAGMTITREQATALLAQALERNYEPRVRKAMGGLRGSTVITPSQHEFDAGVSFDFNTGAIHRASWVKRWLEGASPIAIRGALSLWNKGGGKVLPGLVARRKREADMLLLGIYPVSAPVSVPEPTARWATWALPLSSTEKAAARDALEGLGYAVGDRLDAVAQGAARNFQRDHGLTVDGIIGRATLSTLQRRIDASRKGTAPFVATAAATPVATVEAIAPPDAVAGIDLPEGLEALPLFGAFLWLLHHLWTYRDHVAAIVYPALPRLAAFLRSF